MNGNISLLEWLGAGAAFLTGLGISHWASQHRGSVNRHTEYSEILADLYCRDCERTVLEYDRYNKSLGSDGERARIGYEEGIALRKAS